MRWDLNADLGEGEPPARTRALLRLITSANVACGGHAGTPASMERTVAAVRQSGVRLGAHPGLPGGFGRGSADPVDADVLRMLVLHQAGALAAVARRMGVWLHHIKLHGSLYHAADRDPALARAYLGVVARWFPGVRVYARPGGEVLRRARAMGVGAWPEGFVDRGYRADGSLVPRGEDGDLLRDPASVRARLEAWRAGHGIRSVDGGGIGLGVRTWCVHADTPGAVALARVARSVLGRAGVSPRGGSRPSGRAARAGR